MRKTTLALALMIVSLTPMSASTKSSINSMSDVPIFGGLYFLGDALLNSDKRIREKEEFLENVINDTLSNEELSQMYILDEYSAVNGVCVQKMLAKCAKKKTEEFPMWLFELKKKESDKELIDIVNGFETGSRVFMIKHSGIKFKSRKMKDFQCETIKSTPNQVITYYTLKVSNSESELELGMISHITKYENWMLARHYLFDLNENGPSRSEIIAKMESNRSVREWASRCEEYMTTKSQNPHSF